MYPFRQQTKVPQNSFTWLINMMRRSIGSAFASQGGAFNKTCGDIASDLEVSDYEVFRRAYAWYHGSSALNVERDFRDYLLSGCDDVPFYVRQFTREWRPGLLAA